jgi:hypothetical protein
MTTYRLQDCAGLLPDIYTDSTLTPTIDTYDGKIIYTQQYSDTCWEVIKDAAPTPETLGVLLSFDICQDCLDALANQCGCPPGYTYNTSSQVCESSTSVCPEGYTYNATSQLCEAPTDPCELDLTLVIDRSSSVDASAEYPLYRDFIQQIIDGIQDDGGANRITTDQVRIGIVYFGTSSPIGGDPNLSLQIGGWAPGNGNGVLKTEINNMFAASNGTNQFAGLREGYKNVTGVNSRPGANKRILFITDGWQNRSEGSSGQFNGYVPVNDTADTDCTTLGGVGGNMSNAAPLNICHAGADLVNGTNNSTYTYRKREMYKQVMDLAQDIKSGTGPDCTTPVDITLIIVGNTNERLTTKGSLVGLNPTGTGPSDYCYFNVNSWASAAGITVGGFSTTNAIFWDADYQYTDGGGNWLRFPSNNAAGEPDFFETEFQYDSSIINGIVTSLLCTDTIAPIACDSPCILNESTGQCECVSTNYTTCCYDLINCKDGSLYATVNTNNLGFDYLAAYVGSIIVFEGLEECLFVTVSSNCANSTPIDTLTITDSFTTCQECQEAIEINPCYKLTNCNNGDVFIMTQQNLNAYAGLVVELAEYPGLCWTVLETYNCVGEFTTVSIVQGYPDCECCFQYQCV